MFDEGSLLASLVEGFNSCSPQEDFGLKQSRKAISVLGGEIDHDKLLPIIEMALKEAVTDEFITLSNRILLLQSFLALEDIKSGKSQFSQGYKKAVDDVLSLIKDEILLRGLL